MRQYTGALVGLGYDPRTNEALLPDYDSELVFEVDFKEQDIIEVGFATDNRHSLARRCVARETVIKATVRSFAPRSNLLFQRPNEVCFRLNDVSHFISSVIHKLTFADEMMSC